MRDKPNILLIMADQLAAQALSIYGNLVCKTPNIERLASQGVTFNNNYSNNPLCVPSRASMLTGKLSPEIQVYDNGNEIASSVPTMAHYMRSFGYQTFLSGKMHFIGPDQLQQPPPPPGRFLSQKYFGLRFSAVLRPNGAARPSGSNAVSQELA